GFRGQPEKTNIWITERDGPYPRGANRSREQMPKSSPPRPPSEHMTAVHALGRPLSPPAQIKASISPPSTDHMDAVHALGRPRSAAPQTRWARLGRSRGGDPGTLPPATAAVPN